MSDLIRPSSPPTSKGNKLQLNRLEVSLRTVGFHLGRGIPPHPWTWMFLRLGFLWVHRPLVVNVATLWCGFFPAFTQQCYEQLEEESTCIQWMRWWIWMQLMRRDTCRRHVARAVGRLKSGLVYVSNFRCVTWMGKELTRQPTKNGPICPLLWNGLTGHVVSSCFFFAEEEQEWRPVIEFGRTLQDASAWSTRSMPILIYQGNTHSPHESLGHSMRRSARCSLWRYVHWSLA